MAITNRFGTGGRLVALLVVSLLLLEPAVSLKAQSTPESTPPSSLQIVILDGEGALNNIQQRTAREPIVQVQDEKHRPLAGALVLFAIHGGAGGATAAFEGGASTLSVFTDANGVAHAAGLLANNLQGSWQIQVTASMGNLKTTVVIHESNVVPSPQTQSQLNNASRARPSAHWPLSKPVTITIVTGLAVAGAVIYYVVADLNNNSGTQVTTGTGTVGAPSATPGIHFRF
jgi:hypothetical protein